jgi:hypothetical protein
MKKGNTPSHHQQRQSMHLSLVDKTIGSFTRLKTTKG